MATNDQELHSKRLLIIDTDAGIDDVDAILLALSYKDEWKILAITCCYGNTYIDNVCQNVMKTLVVSNETEIPIYRGCEQALTWKGPPSAFHGDDGLGNVADQFPTGSLKISDGHAVNIMTQLARKYPDEITILSIGPLTNLAMAHRMDPEFTKNLKSIVLMGGNIHGEGNVTPAAEFNFYCDPEAAHVMLTEASCPVLMVPWETTVNHAMEWAVYREWIKVNTRKGDFIRSITAHSAKRLQNRKRVRFLDCDMLAAAAVLCPLSIEETIHCPIAVETTGVFTRGQSVIERYTHMQDKDSKKKHIEIVTKFNNEILNELRFKLVKH